MCCQVARGVNRGKARGLASACAAIACRGYLRVEWLAGGQEKGRPSRPEKPMPRADGAQAQIWSGSLVQSGRVPV